MRHPGDHVGDPSFTRTRSQQDEFDRLLVGADIWYGIPDESPASLGRLLPGAPNLRWVQTMAAGGGAQVVASGLPRAALERVLFTTSAGVHGPPLAEFAVLGLLMGAKRVLQLQRDQRAHRWADRTATTTLAGRTVLVLGLGGIGQEVARRCRALGMRVLGVQRNERHSDAVDHSFPPDRLIEAAQQADDLVITLPGTAHTEGMVSTAVLRALGSGATVVNVGRGTVIDEPALLAELDCGTIGFAALDVFAEEPLPATSPLWEHPRVLISPHTAALDADEDLHIAQLFRDNLAAFRAGRPLRNVVDLDAGY
ncbi:D-2-hydroxyacid dehydrogenase [Calidifontibacter sp. DB0510]|uniref:D-2-hydroxyacid dehydrogenase n=2 Tax=Metallococcus carri TaxID=1656884 RepID=A0A967AZ13_9MICO|nr:D-2-hydroxyacid dehydrogenase [Metallococcus carri]NOP36925.1 D-2-hydroxyacid dehydrogenase [Calidifontibacter sp. DB2511S]